MTQPWAAHLQRLHSATSSVAPKGFDQTRNVMRSKSLATSRCVSPQMRVSVAPVSQVSDVFLNMGMDLFHIINDAHESVSGARLATSLTP